MAVAEIVAVFLGPRTGRLVPEFSQKFRNEKRTMMEPTTSGSITNHMFFGVCFQYHLLQGLGMIDVDAWNRLSSPTCQVCWNRFT
jgi:hypothetical protein